MRRKIEPLLCELHAHTRWSDGALTVPELVDLYGRNGFDVLAVTDHVVRRDDPWLPPTGRCAACTRANHAYYLAELSAQAERARREYDLLLVPGLELTYNDPDPAAAAHAVAVGCRTFVGVDGGLDPALVQARAGGAALIAAHPYLQEAGAALTRSRDDALLPRVARAPRRWSTAGSCSTATSCSAGSPSAASPPLRTATSTSPSTSTAGRRCCPASKDEDAVVDYLRSPRPAFLTRIEPVTVAAARRAA